MTFRQDSLCRLEMRLFGYPDARKGGRTLPQRRRAARPKERGLSPCPTGWRPRRDGFAQFPQSVGHRPFEPRGGVAGALHYAEAPVRRARAKRGLPQSGAPPPPTARSKDNRKSRGQGTSSFGGTPTAIRRRDLEWWDVRLCCYRSAQYLSEMNCTSNGLTCAWKT